MEYTQILFDISDHVATITLNRPERLNAFTRTMQMELREALEEAEQNNDIRVIIITGAGRAFSSGMEMNDESDATTAHETMTLSPEKKALHDLTSLKYAFTMKKPVIVAINGAAVGMGITTFLPFDIRIASENARIGFVFTRRGIVPEIGCPWLLPKIIGLSKASELMYSGRILNAREALDYGLVSRVVPKDDLMTAALELANEIAGSSPLSVTLTKAMIYQFLFATDLDRLDEINLEYFRWVFDQADTLEGIMSFLEKRPADWKTKVPKDIPEFFPLK